MSMNDQTAIIITRAQPGAGETLERVTSAHMRGVLSPMLELTQTDHALPPLSRTAGIIFTSANGVRFFANMSDLRDLPVWCVGPATFDAAAEAGFDQRHNADGDGRKLSEYLIARADPSDGPLLHVANAAAAGDVAAHLEHAGFKVVFAPLYRAQPMSSLSPEARTMLEGTESTIILIHSAKGAKAFADAVAEMDLRCHALVAVSQKAAAPIRSLALKTVRIARRPNESGLFQAIAEVRSTL